MMMIIIIVGVIIGVGVLVTTIFLSKKDKEIYSSMIPFECGYEVIRLFLPSYSLRFFYILLIFLIFDVEIVILLSLPVGIKFINMVY